MSHLESTPPTSLMHQAIWAVADQAAFAGSNFLVNVLLARWLDPAAYGAFALAYAIFLFAGVFHNAMLTEPMLVLGASRFADRVPAYVTTLVVGHGLFGAVTCLALGLVGFISWWSGQLEVSRALFVLAASSPFLLLLWLARRIMYLLGTPYHAAAAGALYVVCMGSGIALLHSFERVSVVSAVAVMAAGSLLASGWILSRRSLWSISECDRNRMGETYAAHADYARWSVGVAVLGFVPLQLPVILLPVLRSMAECGEFRALLTLAQPATQSTIAIGAVLLPHFVRQQGRDGFGSHFTRITLLLLVGPLLYWLALGWFHRPITDLLYSGRFTDRSAALWIIGLIPLPLVMTVAFATLLRAMDRQRHIVRSYLVAAICAATLGVGGIHYAGVVGAAWSIVACYAVNTVYLLICGITSLQERTSRETTCWAAVPGR